MDEKIEVKVNKELYNDLSSIMREEYEKRMLITPSYCANKLLEKGYRKERDTAKEILTAIKEDKSGYWDSCDCGKEELHWRDKCVEDTLRMIAEKYGVDLGE